MTSLKPYSFDEMWVKERQADLWRQAEQARLRYENRQATPRTRPQVFRAMRDYLVVWRQRLRWQERPGARLETHEPTPRIRHPVS
jgi:hypothetical protein